MKVLCVSRVCYCRRAVNKQVLPLAAGLKGICSFVFERTDDFGEILAFTNETSRQYGLHVHKLHADFRSGVEALLETTQLKAIILGTRRSAAPTSDAQACHSPKEERMMWLKQNLSYYPVHDTCYAQYTC